MESANFTEEDAISVPPIAGLLDSEKTAQPCTMEGLYEPRDPPDVHDAWKSFTEAFGAC
jgi:hypothetical protein